MSDVTPDAVLAAFVKVFHYTPEPTAIDYLNWAHGYRAGHAAAIAPSGEYAELCAALIAYADMDAYRDAKTFRDAAAAIVSLSAEIAELKAQKGEMK